MTNMNGQPTETKIPEGYLTVAEIAKDYPDWAEKVERGASTVINSGQKKEDGARVMVFLNEPIPLKARLWSTDKVEEVPNMVEYPMVAMDVAWLLGDPAMRLDLTESPEETTVNPQYHAQARGQVLDYCFRRGSRKKHHDAQATAVYGTNEFARTRDAEHLRTIQALNDKHDLWDRLPDLRVKIGARMTESDVPVKKMNERVKDAMVRCEIPLTGKIFTTPQVQSVKQDLLNDAHLYGYDEQIKGKHSDEHIKLLMKDVIASLSD